jgi:TRAP-type mannitol/chloroaromatic compound transport system substrate-binding protein
VSFGQGLGAVLLLAATALASPAASQETRLRVQSGYPLSMPVLGETVAHWDARMRALEVQGLRVRVYDAGKLVPTLSIFDAVSGGRLDAGFAFPAYWMGKIPAAAVFAAVPFGPEAPELLAWLHEGGGLQIWRRLYAAHGVVPVPCGVLPPEASGWFREPIDDASDLRGLKIRYAGLGGKVLKRLGASITMLASGDLFVALERGVLDATEYSMPAVDRPLGFYKVAKHYYFPGWHQPASLLELIVAEEVWEGLAPHQRAALETACDAATRFSLSRGLARQGEALAFFETQGVELHRWPPALMARFREEAAKVMAEEAAADPDFAAAWRSLQAFRARQRDWTDLATLRDAPGPAPAPSTSAP